MTEEANEVVLQPLRERLAAVETLLTELLPMLIQDSRYETDICQALTEWKTDPPVNMRGNQSFADAVQEILDYLPGA